MKNTLKFIGFIALVAIMGFTVLSCGEEDDDPEGKIIFTNLSYHESLTGKRFIGYANMGSYELFFTASQPSGGIIQGVTISGSTITLNVYKTEDEGGTFTLYTGNGTVTDDWKLQLLILQETSFDINQDWNPQIYDVSGNIATITFENGSVTVNFSTQMEWD